MQDQSPPQQPKSPLPIIGFSVLLVFVALFLGREMLPEQGDIEQDTLVPEVISETVLGPANEETPDPIIPQESIPQEAEVVPPPTFDIVRIQPEGNTLIAGQGIPGARMRILLDGEPVGDVIVTPSGTFAIVLQLAPSDEPRTITLAMEPEGTSDVIVSESTIFVAPTTIIAEAAEETNEGQNGGATAPAIALSADNLVTVLPNDPIEAPREVSINSVTYDETGSINLSGSASGDGSVQIYLDNAPIGLASVTEEGNWYAELPNDIDTGLYQLRVDEVTPDGSVVARAEIPFQREAPDTVDKTLSNLGGRESGTEVRVVQPGTTLWAIARERYGQGRLYVKVFDANRDQIRDPDLIYPGQVFQIPQ